MTKVRELYRCEICGNVVEIAHEGAPALVCCEQPMNKLEAKTSDEGQEKHVPIIVEKTECSCECSEDTCVEVQVGSVQHPMEDKHYIKFIEVLTADQILRAELKPGVAPSAKFCIKKEDIVEIREFCTVHMLWKK